MHDCILTFGRAADIVLMLAEVNIAARCPLLPGNIFTPFQVQR